MGLKVLKVLRKETQMPSPLSLIGILENFLIGLFAGAGWILATNIVQLLRALIH